MNSTAVKMGGQIPLWYPDFSSFGYKSRSRIAGSYSSSFTFWGTIMLFAQGMQSFYNPIKRAQEFQLLQIWTNTCYFVFPNGCEMISPCGFDLHFLMIIMLSIFSHSCWQFVCSLWRNVHSSPLPIFKLCYLIFYAWVIGVLHIFWILMLFQCVVCIYLLSFL